MEGMAFDAGTWWLAAILLTVLTGICGWALKRASERTDKTLEELRGNTVPKGEFAKELDSVKGDIREIQKNYTPRAVHEKDFDECRRHITQISEKYLTKEDFFREQAKTDRKLGTQDKKLDRILELLMAVGKDTGL